MASPVRLPVFLKRKTTAPRPSAKPTRLPPLPKLPRPLLNKFQPEIFEKGGLWPPFLFAKRITTHNIRHNSARFAQDCYCDTLLLFQFLDETQQQVHMTGPIKNRSKELSQ
ncbi:hypothetical protein ECB98_00370 [Brucellaceae bacterium VT-16-1752]|nr:hypothetical protein ECB98_00370 [Brucellaceae bacterium VT-16-1752]